MTDESVPERIRRILSRPRTLAVVGMSRDPSKAAHRVPMAMLGRGYRIIPVNPRSVEISGLRCRATLAEIGEEVDVVLVFRPSSEAPGVAAAAAARRSERGDAGVLWLQLGIRSDQARSTAEEAGILYIEDKCMDVEYGKLFG